MKKLIPIITLAALIFTNSFSKAQCNAIILATDSTICNGDSTSLNAIVVISCGPWTFQWSPNGETTSSINAKPTVTTTYVLTSTDSGGIAQSDTFTVFVANCNAGCGVTAAAKKNGLCLGDSTTIRAMSPLGCLQPLTYTWMPGGETTQGISVKPTTTTTFTLTATDGTNTYVDSTQILVVNCTNCSVSIVSPDTAICKGNSALLNASMILTCPNLTLTWTPGNISGGSALVSPTVTTTYTLSGFDGVRTFTDTFKVKVNICGGIKEDVGITEFNSIVNRQEEKLTLIISTQDIRSIETKLMSITGQVLQTTQLQNNSMGVYTHSYSTVGLAPGVYIISVFTDKGVLSQKIVLQ